MLKKLDEHVFGLICLLSSNFYRVFWSYQQQFPYIYCMLPLAIEEKLQPFYTNKYASLSYLPQEKIALCTAMASYIPIKDFQALFGKASELISQESISTFIFDKRKLTVFNQPSMEWYHVVWKQEMYSIGLLSHRKLLPTDKIFEQSVITGKALIQRKYPDFDFSKYNILYCQTLKQAFEV